VIHYLQSTTKLVEQGRATSLAEIARQLEAGTSVIETEFGRMEEEEK
jgi:hypothetical protein